MQTSRTKTRRCALAGVLAATLLSPLAANAGSIYAKFASVTGTGAVGEVATFDLIQDFGSDVILGGGVTVTLGGPISLSGAGFAPSAYFNDATKIDPAFSGFSTSTSAPQVSVHFGSFSGVTGTQTLGQILVKLDGAGTGQLDVSDDAFWGGWPLVVGGNANVGFAPPVAGQNQVAAVPVPGAGWLLGSALVALVRRVSLRRETTSGGWAVRLRPLRLR